MSVAAMALWTAGALFGATPQAQELSVEGCDFGEAYAFNEVECQIEILNSGTRTIHVNDVVPVAALDRIEPKQLEIKPASKAYLHATLYTGNAFSKSRHRFTIKTDEPGHEERLISARGFVLTALDQVAPKLEFGVVDATAADSRTKRITLTSHETTRFQISKILEQPKYVDVELLSDHQTIEAKIKKDAPWGAQSGVIRLAIDTPNQKEAWVTVNADIHGDVVPAINPIDLGLLRFGNRNEQLVQLTSRSKKDFKIDGITLEKIVGAAETIPCVHPEPGCRLLKLTISDKQPPGAIQGFLSIGLPEFEQTLRIDARGLILGQDVKVDEVNPFKDDPAKADAPWSGSHLSSDAGHTPDLGKALKSAVANDHVPEGTGPLLKWALANGQPVYGFQIFRADDEKGPFLVVNKATIRSTAEDEMPVSYQYRDNTAKTGNTYWYYIGTIYQDGHKQQLSEPQKVTAK